MQESSWDAQRNSTATNIGLVNNHFKYFALQNANTGQVMRWIER